MDLLYGGKVDTFALVSSDSDFTPLVMRLRAEGLPVIGFGRKQTPAPFTRACSDFLFLEQLDTGSEVAESNDQQEAGNSYQRKTPNELKSDTRLMNLLRKAIDTSKDEQGWAFLGAVGSLIKNQEPFDPRNYGYKKLGDLVRAIDLFECEERKGGSLYVRDRRAKQG